MMVNEGLHPLAKAGLLGLIELLYEEPSSLTVSLLKLANLIKVSTKFPELIVIGSLGFSFDCLRASISACYQMMFMRSIPCSFSNMPLELMIMKSSSVVICMAVISGSGLTI